MNTQRATQLIGPARRVGWHAKRIARMVQKDPIDVIKLLAACNQLQDATNKLVRDHLDRSRP